MENAPLSQTTQAILDEITSYHRGRLADFEASSRRRYRAGRLAESQGIPSLARAIVAMQAGSLRADAPLEFEMFTRGGDDQRLHIPFDQLRDLTVASAGAGGFLVSAEVQDPVDILRPWSVTARAGVMIEHNLVGDQAIPRTTGKATPYWLANESSQVTPSAPTLGQVVASAKTCGALIAFSRQLSKQANAEQFVSRELLKTIGGAIDQAVLNGSGSDGQPTGIIGTDGVQTQSGSTLNSGVRTMKKLCAEANADDSRISFISTPAIRETLEGRQLFTGGDRTVWQDDTVAGRPAHVSTTMPTATMLAGDFSNCWLGLWSGVTIEVNPYDPTGFKSGVIQARLLISCDVAVLHPSAFVLASSIT